MKIRMLLTLTAIVSSVLGAVVVYLAMSVPNDLRADAMLKQARTEMAAGRRTRARELLGKVIQQYPRTDAAAAATVALSGLGHGERSELVRAIAVLRRQNEQQSKEIAALQAAMKAPPAQPAATATTVTAEPEKPPETTKKAPARKTAPKKTTRRRR